MGISWVYKSLWASHGTFRGISWVKRIELDLPSIRPTGQQYDIWCIKSSIPEHTRKMLHKFLWKLGFMTPKDWEDYATFDSTNASKGLFNWIYPCTVCYWCISCIIYIYVCIYNYAGHKRCCPLVSSNLGEPSLRDHRWFAPFLSEDLYLRRRNGQWKQHTDLLYTYTWNHQALASRMRKNKYIKP